MRRIAYVLPFVVSLSLVACSAPDEGNASASSALGDEPAATFVDLSDYVSEGGVDLYYGVVRSLERGFDDICGDTFCEGDYANLTSLRFRCSVTSADGTLGSCVWVFAGSQEQVDPATGAITVDAKTFSCAIPVSGEAQALLDTLGAAGEDALYAPLPGTDASIYDALVDCL